MKRQNYVHNNNGRMKIFDLVVLDLDLTLWPFRVDDRLFPFLEKDNNVVVDSAENVCSLYPEVESILNYLSDCGFVLAIASRIENICGAYQLLHLFNIAHYFSYKEIYPLSKRQHFTMLAEKSRISYNKTIFFDDDRRNLKTVKCLGVSTCQVIGGLTLEFVKCCLKCT